MRRARRSWCLHPNCNPRATRWDVHGPLRQLVPVTRNYVQPAHTMELSRPIAVAVRPGPTGHTCGPLVATRCSFEITVHKFCLKQSGAMRG